MSQNTDKNSSDKEPNKPESSSQKAKIGQNLRFESEGVRKNREEKEKKKQIKKQREKDIQDLNSELMDLIKHTNTDLTQEEKDITMTRIKTIKAEINQKIKERQNEETKEKEEKYKAVSLKKKSSSFNSSYVSEKVKKKVIVNKCFELELKITDQSIMKKPKLIFEKLKVVAPGISDCRPTINDMVKVKLLHANQEKLMKDIEGLNSFEITKIEESKTEKPARQYGGYIRNKPKYYHQG
mmetsp:Transcript_35366/g.35024  ORF Transcript_35366/g.35024 Transcript_35366/m.35024 type:complete len:239 (-) Transcript_35366:39-755(-)